jgi:hypothetical protein
LDVKRGGKSSAFLCDSLIKTEVYIPTEKEEEQGIPPPPRYVSINMLLQTKVNNQIFFRKIDSLTLITQYNKPKKIAINPSLTRTINLISYKEALSKKSAEERIYFHTISAPLFSKDGKKAYIQTGFYCGRLCGSGKAIFLEKLKGKWKIVKSYETWMS